MDSSILYLFKSSFLLILLWLLISLLLFLAIREIVLWYFKINEVSNSLDRIANSLELIALGEEEITIEKEPVEANQSITEPIIAKTVVAETLDKRSDEMDNKAVFNKKDIK